jgi:hypothetical protein
LSRGSKRRSYERTSIVSSVGFALGAEVPAGEHAGQGGHVVLGVSGVDAQRVKFEQLAGVVLVE